MKGAPMPRLFPLVTTLGSDHDHAWTSSAPSQEKNLYKLLGWRQMLLRGKAPAKLHSLIASLDAKYAKSTARKGEGKREPSVAPEEPTDEQFEAARARLENGGATHNVEATASQPATKKGKKKR
ncbi:hypothetical protein ABBQ38_005787 [Trebouxia sp. C0009 RCD-2024]